MKNGIKWKWRVACIIETLRKQQEKKGLDYFGTENLSYPAVHCTYLRNRISLRYSSLSAECAEDKKVSTENGYHMYLILRQKMN